MIVFSLFTQTWFVILTVCVLIFIIWVLLLPDPGLTIRDLKIPKRKFVLAVLHWCSENLGTIKHGYDLKIHYFQNKKYSGLFLSWNNQIILYVYDDLELIELVDTVIHEYTHYLQLVKKANVIDYDMKIVKIGYWYNPYEVEARRLAKQHRKDCLDWVIRNYSI